MTKIQWTEKTWNPIAGCSVVSPGCTNCYAMKMAPRLAANPATPHYAGTVQNSKGGPVWTGKIGIASDSVLTQPLRRKKPTMYFVNSMSDLFHENVPDGVIDRIFAVMALCRQHKFQVLTKRADRMREYMLERWQGTVAREVAGFAVPAGPETGRMHQVELAAGKIADDLNLCDPDDDTLYDENERCIALQFDWPLPNVWLGVSVEDQARADERIPLLLNTPAAVRFISAEPLLGPVDLTDINHSRTEDGFYTNAAEGFILDTMQCEINKLDWVICGGESGPKARMMRPEWARALRDQCSNAGVPFFMKQMTKKASIPDDLMVREYPS